MTTVIRIRPMTAEDLPLGMRLKSQAGWNQDGGGLAAVSGDAAGRMPGGGAGWCGRGDSGGDGV